MDALLLTLVGTVVGTVLAAEARAWLRQLGWRVTQRAIERLLETWPEEERARWREEIEADFASYVDRPLAGLVFSLRLRWSAFRPSLARLSPRRRLIALLDRWEQMSDDEREEAIDRFSAGIGAGTRFASGTVAARYYAEREERWKRAAARRKRAEARERAARGGGEAGEPERGEDG